MSDISQHVRSVQEGDVDSLEWLVLKLDPLLRAQARYRLGADLSPHVDVEDIVQEVWFVLFQRIGDLRSRGGRLVPVLLKFASKVSTRTINRFYRKLIWGKPGQETIDDSHRAAVDLLEGSVAGGYTLIHQHEIHARISHALTELGPDQREAFILRAIEGRTNQDAARHADKKPNTLAKNYERAVTSLQKVLPDLDEMVGP